MKKRKSNIVFFLIVFAVAFILIIFFGGCKTTKETVIIQEKKKTEVESDSLVVWTQDLKSNLKVSDSLYFYNEKEIKIQKILSNDQTFVKNHKIVSIDSTLRITDTIPARTAGELKMEPIRRRGVIDSLLISYKLDNTTTNLYFFRRELLPPKFEIIKNKKGKVIDRKIIPTKNPDFFTIDSTKIIVEYNKIKYPGKMLLGTQSIILVGYSEKTGEKRINRIAKSLLDEKK